MAASQELKNALHGSITSATAVNEMVNCLNRVAATGSAYTQTYSTASATVAAAITDNSTGSASDTIAAGVGVGVWEFEHTFIGGTSAVEPVTDWTPGHKFKILSWSFVTEVLLVGASGSRVANMEIGTTDVGTVASTCTIPIANAAVGTVTAGTAVSGANTGTAASTFSIEIASGGTAFTAGSGTFRVVYQNMDTADAIASLSAKLDARAQNINRIIDDMQAAGAAT